jgi:hypothetical protein
MLIYRDAVCTKIELEQLDNEIFIRYTIITANLLSILFKDKNKINNIREFNAKILVEPDELFQIRIEKEN